MFDFYFIHCSEFSRVFLLSSKFLETSSNYCVHAIADRFGVDIALPSTAAIACKMVRMAQGRTYIASRRGAGLATFDAIDQSPQSYVLRESIYWIPVGSPTLLAAGIWNPSALLVHLEEESLPDLSQVPE
jgi:hypothetical protein